MYALLAERRASKIVRVLHGRFHGVCRFSGPAALRVRLCMSLPPAVGFYALILALFYTAPPFLQNTLLSAEMPRGMHDYECLCRWLPVWSQVSF